MLAAPQVNSVKIAAAFTVVQGQVSNLGWMFRQDTYSDADQTVRVFNARLIPVPGDRTLHARSHVVRISLRSLSP